MTRRFIAVNCLCGCALLVSVVAPSRGQNSGRRPLASGAPMMPPVTKSIDDARIDPEVLPGSIENAEYLVPFFEKLHRISSGPSEEMIHILHFGDSHTTGDLWTGPLRTLFQQRFGDGGSGFSLAGHPFAGYRRLDAPGGSSAGWKTSGLHPNTPGSYLGLGGVSIEAQHAGQSVYLNADCDLLEIDYLQQPNGGGVAIYENNQLLEEFSTAGNLQGQFREISIHPGSHHLSLVTTGQGPVRLFGWAADKREGVTYEALGLNGVRASVLLDWDEAMFSTYLKRRDPALIVLAYGTNEAVDLGSAAGYEDMFSDLLSRLRRLTPDAAILVIGPPDIYPRNHDGAHWSAEVDRVIQAQRNASRANGCAFWDLRQHMGGAGAVREWAALGLAQRDYVHLSAAGYRRVADSLFADVTHYYETYERVRLQILGTQ